MKDIWLFEQEAYTYLKILKETPAAYLFQVRLDLAFWLPKKCLLEVDFNTFVLNRDFAVRTNYQQEI